MADTGGIRAGKAYVELFTKDSRYIKGLRNAQRRLQAFSVATRQIGRRLLAVSAVLSLPIIAGTKIYADFEQQMAQVSTMLDDPAAHMDKFREGIRQMQVEFGESSEALAGGLYDILSASVPAGKALDVLAVAAKAAKAGITDTATSADAITTILNSYNMEAERAGDVSDWLFSIVKRGKTTFAELAPSIGLVASIAASAGVGLDELGASVATLTRNGVQTENAITAVTQVIAAFLKPAAEAVGFARELGFEMSSTTLQTEGLEGVFKRIQHLPPDAIAKLFPNIRALRGVIPALKNIEGLSEDIVFMGDRAGRTEDAYQKMAGTLIMVFNRIKEAGKVALSIIGEAISEPLSRAGEAIQRYIQVVTGLLEKNKDLVVVAVKIVAIVAAVGGTLFSVGIAAAIASVAIGGLVGILTGVGTIIATVGAAFGALLTPIGLVAAAVVGLGAYFVSTTDISNKALAWLGNQFQGLKDTAMAAFQGIKDALIAGDIRLAARVLWTALRVEFREGVNWLMETWIGFKENFMTVWTDAVDSLAGLWIKAVTGMKELWLEFTSTLVTGWEKGEKVIAKGIGWIIAKVKGLDPAEVIANVKEDYDRQKRERDKATEDRSQTLQAEKQSQLATLDEMAGEENKERQERYAAELQALQDELDTARKEFDQAAGEAKAKREVAESPEGADWNAFDEWLAKLTAGEQAGAEAAAMQRDKAKIAGTFSASAAGRLGGSRHETKLLTATERIAKSNEEIKRLTRDNVLKYN